MNKNFNHGLSTWLNCAKGWRSYDHNKSSAIDFLRTWNPSQQWKPFRPSDHIKRFCFRALRGKPRATLQDWNNLVEKLIARGKSSLGTSPSIRRSCKVSGNGEIAGWFKDTLMPISAEDIQKLGLDYDRKKEKAENLKAMMDRAMKELNGYWVPKTLKNGKPSKCKFDYYPGRPFSFIRFCAKCKKSGPKNAFNFYIYGVGMVCIGCNNKHRGQQKQIEKAEQALRDLSAQVKSLNKAIKERKNGTQ